MPFVAFLSYLWGMETLGNFFQLSWSCSFQFLSYLWGMETTLLLLLLLLFLFVRSYPTYEEWKLRSLSEQIIWNSRFLSYLWGMETFFNNILVLIFFKSSYPTYEEWKLYEDSKKHCYKIRSYPTYEEWKHLSQSHLLLLSLRSYPTYEEWKPEFAPSFKAVILRSYPTYEEWKPYCPLLFCFLPLFCSYPTYEEWKRSNFSYIDNTILVLILPMRNGNSNISKISICSLASPFLSYLWGMETTRILNKS